MKYAEQMLLRFLAMAAGPASAAAPFDGRWSVTVSCPGTGNGTLGCTYRFPLPFQL